MNDPFSDVLDLVGVRSSVYFQKDFLSPWCMSVSNTGFAQFHIIVRGNAVVTHGGVTTQLAAGDVILFPKGAAHMIGDAPDSAPLSGQDVISAMANGQEPFLEGGIATRMICGHFEYDFDCTHPLLEELPPMVLLRSAELPAMDHLFGLVQLIVRESSSDTPGKDVVVRRLSDGLLVTILRAYFESRQQDAGFYRGVTDKRMSRVIAAIHGTAGDNLTVEKLATIAGMSRSSFLHHFKTQVGQSAGAYSTRWKLLKSRVALSDTSDSVESIAYSAGYNSTSAFSRAFHGNFGLTPTEFRSQRVQG
ncbi:AraC family transcriptional regulator [Rhodobacteraceae bacterium]|nr:AraC family transcriptional regulator [Paracoccaceae bacterium]